MGILRRLPVGLGAAAFERGASAFAAWASTSPPGTAAASRPLVAARNSLRPMAEFLGSLFMRLLDKRSNGVSTNISAALYVTVALKGASKIVFLIDSIGLPDVKGKRRSEGRRTFNCDSTVLGLLRFEAFAALQAVGLNEFLIGRERLLCLRQAANAAVRLTELKVRSVAVGRKLLRSFETFDGASGISLLQECAAKFELGHFIIRLSADHLAQKGHRLLRVALQEKRVAKMIAGDQIGRVNFQLGAKLSSRRFEIALTKVDEAREIVGSGKPRIKLQCSFQLREAARKIFLLRVRLPQEKVNRGVARVLLQQPAENVCGNLGLPRSNECRTPSEEQPRIVRGALEKWMQNLGGFLKVVRRKITEPEKLANEGIVGSRGEPALQRRYGLGIKLGAIAGKTPIAVEAGEPGLPRGSLLEVSRGIREIGSFGAHDAKIIIGAGEDFRRERAVFFRGLGFRGWLRRRRRLSRRILLDAALHHRFRGFLLIVGAGFEQAGDAIGSVAIAVGNGRGLVENVLGVIAELRFAIALRIRERFLGFLQAAETAQILAKQVIGAADVARNLLGVVHKTDIFFEGFDGLGETLRFVVRFAEIEIGE